MIARLNRLNTSIPLALAVLFVASALPAFCQDSEGPQKPPPQAAEANPAGAASTAANHQSGLISDPAAAATQPGSAAPNAAKPAPARVEVPTGTHIPLVLHNAISTRSAKIGDPIYLETLFPVMVNGKVAIPAG